ncbi:hypothetical protein Rhe02_94660 [Rhizocola hellebori]|uniref:Septum formation-related domain-containing protein n=1 Tax=Rhizocola hellebori TaxID=1392758 RepID=A0A8J3QHU6_9ACTN|nr:septum formation family protein [Rhizocola hellebori]GIH11399.1 hypothetical protein Rhe02_94660 [Rhizocola hellebori]
MRIRRQVFGCVLALSALLAACGGPAPPPPPPPPVEIWKPAVGACHDGFTFSLSEVAYEEVSCTQPHIYETFHVGTFADSLTEPPVAGSEEFKDKWAFCENLFSGYFGGDWRERQLRLRIAAPKPAAWRDGARWFLCAVTVWTLHGAVIKLPRSLKGGFSTMPELEYGCIERPDRGAATYASHCDQPHNAEYVGHLSADRIDPQAICSAEIDKFTATVGVYGQWLIQANPEDWEIGDRHLRCFLLADRAVTKSLKAAPPR